MANPLDLDAVTARIKTLLNTQLKNVCRDQGLPVSGTKSDLQRRLFSHLDKLAAQRNFDQISKMREIVIGRGSAPSQPSHLTVPSPLSSGANPQSAQHTRPPPSAHGTAPKVIQFKASPFYSVEQPLSEIHECPVRENTKQTVDVPVILSPEVASKLQYDEQYRAMMFCCPDTGLNAYSASDVAFPHQVELKVNGDDVKANLRGLKNKPGSTRPADITSLLRKLPGYTNRASLTYALTHKEATWQKFFLLVHLVRKTPVESLVQRLQAGKAISKEQVLKEMKSKAQDPDIVATSSIMSLKCPLSTLRIEVPCRSLSCRHNQCFDASSYLQLQEQAPTWTCPICNKPATFETLLIDQYVDDILRSTSRSVDQVTIEPEGQWSKHILPETPGPSHDSTSAADDENDFVEIQQRRVSGRADSHYHHHHHHHPPLPPPPRATPSTIYTAATNTPPLSSREQSVTSSAQRTNKRPASAVIDLTLSDDEDERRKQPRLKMPETPIVGMGSASPSPWNGHVQFHIPRPPSLSTPASSHDANQHRLL